MTVEDLEGEMRVFAKIRYNHKGDWCTVRKTGEDEIECIFETPQRAVTPGQALVLYDGDYVLWEAEQFWDSSELFRFLVYWDRTAIQQMICGKAGWIYT